MAEPSTQPPVFRETLFGAARADRPFVVLKLATSLDGRIATATGKSAWITGDIARAFGHRLRAEADAVLVGTRTAGADDPDLTCRLPGLEHLSPRRIVLDRKLQLRSGLKLFRTAKKVPTLLLTSAGASTTVKKQRRAQGVEIIEVAEEHGDGLSVDDMLAKLSHKGVERLLVEGGGQVAASLLKAGAVDRLVWFHAPKILGGDGRAAVGPLGLKEVADGGTLRLKYAFTFGMDRAQVFDLE